MDLAEYRSQFDLHFLVPFSEEFQGIKVNLRENGHSVFHSTSQEQFNLDFKQSPSHLVIIDYAILKGSFDEFLAECLEVACQTNFILLGPSKYRKKFWNYRDYGVLDYISLEDSLIGMVEWVVENALERVVLKLVNKNLVETSEELKNRNELLKTQLQEAKTLAEGFIETSSERVVSNHKDKGETPQAFDSDFDSYSDLDPELNPIEGSNESNIHESNFHQNQEMTYQEEDLSNLLTLYENTRNCEDLMQVFFHSLETFCQEDAKVLYFKFLEPVQLLVATHGVGVPVDDIKGAGIRLTQEEVLDASNLLTSPRGFGSLNKLLQDVFHVEQCYVKPLLIREAIDGLFVFFGDSIEIFNSIKLSNRFSLFKVSFERFSFLKRQVELELEDLLTNIKGYEDFYEMLSDRLEQLKRQQLGLSMIRISIDKLQNLEEQYGPTATTSLIRSLALTFKGFCKTNDSLFRTASNEFILLASYLKPQEATVLAERLRLSAEGLTLPPLTGSISISIGVSTYPQLATNAETLIKSSLQALSAAMSQGGNKVGIARVVIRPKITKFSPIDIDGKG